MMLPCVARGGGRAAVDPGRLGAFLDRPMPMGRGTASRIATASRLSPGGALSMSIGGPSYVPPGSAPAGLLAAAAGPGGSLTSAAWSAALQPRGALPRGAEDRARVVTWGAPRGAGDAEGGIFAQAPTKRRGHLPKPEAVQLVEGDGDDSDGDSVAKQVLAAPDADDLWLEQPRFVGTHIRQPRVVRSPRAREIKPVEGLASPAQRRAELQLETNRLRARRAMRKARLDKQRTETLMRVRHPTGVLGFDAPGAEGTRAYREETLKRNSIAMKAATHAAARQEFLASRDSSRTRRGYDIIGHSSEPPPAEATLTYQRKRQAGERVDTHYRLFDKTVQKVDHTRRILYNREQETKGRHYDIISGAEFSNFPPSGKEIKHKRQAHPSLTTSIRFTDR